LIAKSSGARDTVAYTGPGLGKISAQTRPRVCWFDASYPALLIEITGAAGRHAESLISSPPQVCLKIFGVNYKREDIIGNGDGFVSIPS
jgi:hypothetical protein